MAYNKKSQPQKAVGPHAKFRRDGLSGQADGNPGGNKGKGMESFKNKQAKYGNKPDKNGGPAKKERGMKHDSAYGRSGGQIG